MILLQRTESVVREGALEGRQGCPLFAPWPRRARLRPDTSARRDELSSSLRPAQHSGGDSVTLSSGGRVALDGAPVRAARSLHLGRGARVCGPPRRAAHRLPRDAIIYLYFACIRLKQCEGA